MSMRMESESGVRFTADSDAEGVFVVFDRPVEVWPGKVMSDKVYVLDHWLDWESFADTMSEAEYA